MQRAREDHCPLCRGAVVMQADSSKQFQVPDTILDLTLSLANLDPALINFLKKYFPAEVKAKQRANEHDAGIDRYGERYIHSTCRVM